MTLLSDTVAAVRPLDAAAVAAARERQARLTKPPGSLGVLEDVSAQLAGLAGRCPPGLPAPAAVAVFAGDHGVHAEGVSAWPQEVTAQMVANFVSGGAVVNAFAAQMGAHVLVVDVGVAADLPPVARHAAGPALAGLRVRKVRRGTADMTRTAAMSRDEAVQAIQTGIETARELVAAGHRCLVTGDMGIANTTASAVLIAAVTRRDPAEVTGRGAEAVNPDKGDPDKGDPDSGDSVYARKLAAVRTALRRHAPDPADPVGLLAGVGGLEHAALAGFVLGGAALRVPVILDGVIAGAAALVAAALAPDVTAACIAGHRSTEPGHAVALAHLGLRPLVDLGLRLGEGTGALLALPLVQSAARVLRDVATFDSAGVHTAERHTRRDEPARLDR